MQDAGTAYTDSAVRAMERRFRSIYRKAQEEIIGKLNEHTKALNALDEVKRAKVENGELSPEAYKRWLNGQVFTDKQWKDKVDSVATSLLYANQQANDIVEGKKRAVFGENATFQAFKMEHDAGMDLSFGIYDSAAVTNLIKEQPELLPRRKVDANKDRGWNQTKIANCITQGIIQGESIQKIADRIARDTASSNEKAMVRYARTAMTGAQNAGRMEMLHEAQEMGIKVKKKWLATLDSRTRDSHAYLDGQVQEVDKPFRSLLGNIDYPGDFHAHPADVWNCRCTLIYVYTEYPERKSERTAYVEYIDDNGKYHRESYKSPNVTYNVWKLVKDKKNQQALEKWREENPFTNDKNNSIIYGEKVIRAVGSKSPTYPIVDDPKTGKQIEFVPGSRPIYPPDHTMAGKGCKTGRQIDELDDLEEHYQVGRKEEWQKEKAIYEAYNEYGEEAYVELHYYQHPDVGKVYNGP